jgi:hypothetical protein
MKHKLLTLIATSTLIAACEQHKSSIEDSPSEQYTYICTIHNNETVFNWVDDILNSKYLTTEFSESMETVQNIHDPSQTDTILRFRTDKSNVNVYTIPSKTMLMESDLYDSEIALSNRIKIGVKKEVVFEVLNQKFANDTIEIMEEDGYGVFFKLYFQDDRLSRIYFKSFID